MHVREVQTLCIAWVIEARWNCEEASRKRFPAAPVLIPPPLPFLHTELSIPRIFYVQPVISKLPSGTVQIIFYIINPDTQKSTSFNTLAHKEEEEEASCESNVN